MRGRGRGRGASFGPRPVARDDEGHAIETKAEGPPPLYPVCFVFPIFSPPSFSPRTPLNYHFSTAQRLARTTRRRKTRLRRISRQNIQSNQLLAPQLCIQSRRRWQQTQTPQERPTNQFRSLSALHQVLPRRTVYRATEDAWRGKDGSTSLLGFFSPTPHRLPRRLCSSTRRTRQERIVSRGW